MTNFSADSVQNCPEQENYIKVMVYHIWNVRKSLSGIIEF